MTASPYRAEPLPPTHQGDALADGHEDFTPAFDQAQWSESVDERGASGAGGRTVLGWALGVLALGWTAYAFWSAGRVLASGGMSSPALAQWVAIAAGPLALMGLVWLMFGRTRRKEAERFTRSVIAMRTEARALQDILGALSQQIEQNHGALGMMAGDLMGLGDQAASRLGSVTADLNAGSRALAEHGAALDRAAQSARLDIGVLLHDLPLAEESAARMAESLRGAGQSARQEAAKYERQVAELHETTRDTDAMVHDAAQRLVAHLTHIESAGAAAAAQIGEAGLASSETVNALLMRASDALDQIRAGIDDQAAAVSALVEQASAGIGRAGMEASEAIGARLSSANGALDSLSARIAEQDAASQRMVGDLDAGLAALDQRFAALAEAGDERAARVQGTIGQLRGDLEALGGETAAHDGAIEALAERTNALRAGVGELAHSVATELAASLGEAEGGAARLQAAIEQARPTLGWMRDASAETSERIEAGAAGIEEQHERLAALLAAVDTGVGGAERRLAELGQAIGGTSEEAARLTGETGPALIAALTQVRETASHAAERARAAIAEVIPASAGELGEATRKALEKAVREAVEDKLAEVDRVAARAVETARAASDRLTGQMLSIGQSAAALEAHLEAARNAQRKDDGEAFARRVSLLMDSMHSASIDVQKILSDEVDEKAWGAYLKGNRGVFTRRAVRLLGGTETRAIAQHYEVDPEFQESVNRYVHDFEAMLRRILAERDGGMIAVTLMSSDMGRLYAALAQAVDKRR